MKVRLLYFASLRERAGCSESEEIVEPGTTVGALWKMVRDRAPFASVAAPPGFSVNCEWSDAARVLADGDEVGLLPPVSGGA